MSTNNNISGNYRKVEVVGRGSFGSAILVQSVTDRKYYIMKVIDVSKMDRKQKEEAVNEVTFLKSMRHPFIVTYRESFMDKNRYLCIVMDYADGGDMYTKIAKQKKLNKGFSESQILDWFVQISLAMKYIHDRKILHRDLKTQNIFLTGKGEIKIGDFGIARVLQDTYDCAQTAIGTPYYLSPEICQEKPYNQKSDIWSLGCMLYEMATLRHAFDANTMKGLVLKILRGSYPAIPSGYSQDLRDLISEMLSREPKSRPSIKKILEKPFLAGPLSNLLNNLANRDTQRDVEKDLGDTIMDQVKMSKIIDPKNQLSNVISKSSQQQSASNSISQSKLRTSFDGKNSDAEQKSKALLPQDESQSKLFESKNTSQTRSYQAQITSNQSNANPNAKNILPSKENSYQKATIDQHSIDSSNERRNSFSAHRSSMEKISDKVPYQPNRINTEEENKSSDLPPVKKTAKTSGNANSNPQSSLQNKYNEKENNILGELASEQNFDSKDKKEEKDKINNLISDVKKVLYPMDKKKAEGNTSDDDDFEEDPSQRVVAKFLTIEGNELPGVDTKDSICYRIEALKVYLETQLGEEPFYSVYRILSEQNIEDDHNEAIQKILGPSKSKFLPLIYQMIVCEDEYYGNANK